MGKNRADCPACGRPLKYDEASNCMVCPAGHYSEPVKNDVNIDSHDQIVNNYYQGPAAHQTDNRGSYEQMVQRLEAFVANDDDDGVSAALADLRDSYPQTYFGKIVNIWFSNQITTLVFNPNAFVSNLSKWPNIIASTMKEDLSDDDPSGVTHLSYEVAYRLFSKLDQLGVATKEQKNVVQQGSDVEPYVNAVEKIVEFIQSATAPSVERLIKYDFETNMANSLKTCLPLAQKLLKNLCDLVDDILKFVNANYSRCKENVCNQAVSDSGKVSKPTQKYSGFALTLTCGIFELLAFIFALVSIFFDIKSDQTAILAVCLIFSLQSFFPFHFVLSIIKNKVAKSRDGIFFWINIAGAIASFVAICIYAGSGNEVAKNVFAIIAAGCALAMLIRSCVRLPKLHALSKDIKAAHNSYLLNQVAAEENYDRGIAGAKFDSYDDMIDAYTYDFSKWNR